MNWNEPKTIYVAVALGLVALRYLFELWLDHLNTRHVKKHANAIPEPFKEIMDEQTYQKSVRYTLAKARYSTISDTYSTVLVIGLLFFGTIAIVFNSISKSREFHFAQATTLGLCYGSSLCWPCPFPGIPSSNSKSGSVLILQPKKPGGGIKPRD